MGGVIHKYVYCHFVLPVYSFQLTWLTVIKIGFWKPVAEEIPIFRNNYLELISFFMYEISTSQETLLHRIISDRQNCLLSTEMTIFSQWSRKQKKNFRRFWEINWIQTPRAWSPTGKSSPLNNSSLGSEVQ